MAAIWSPDFDDYASGKKSASEIRCALCTLCPCQCPPFGTPAYFALTDYRHGKATDKQMIILSEYFNVRSTDNES